MSKYVLNKTQLNSVNINSYKKNCSWTLSLVFIIISFKYSKMVTYNKAQKSFLLLETR